MPFLRLWIESNKFVDVKLYFTNQFNNEHSIIPVHTFVISLENMGSDLCTGAQPSTVHVQSLWCWDWKKKKSAHKQMLRANVWEHVNVWFARVSVCMFVF